MLTTSDIDTTMGAVRKSAEENPKEMAKIIEAVGESLECKEFVFSIFTKMWGQGSTEMAILKGCYTFIAFGIATGMMLRESSGWVVAGVGRA